MADLSHQFGSDLEISPSGDLRVTQGSSEGQQRVLRRLLTNPGDYIWSLDYGAGLGTFVGTVLAPARIGAVIREQMFREPMVARRPEPVITVQAQAAGADVAILYQDRATSKVQTMTFFVGG